MGAQQTTPEDQTLASLEALAVLGRRTQPAPLLTTVRTAFEGARVNFVSTARGDLAFSIIDLQIQGAMPLFFQRVYTSDGEDRGMGLGWSFGFDDRISVQGDRAVMKTGGGATLNFVRQNGARFVLERPEPGQHQAFDLLEGKITEEIADLPGLVRTYLPAGGEYLLTEVADANGNRITINRDANGRILSLETGGARIDFEWSWGLTGHLMSVRDHTGRRVSFRYSNRLLSSVIDAAGAEWRYKYQANRLTRVVDPEGRTVLKARYDALSGRVLQTSDAVSVYDYKYDNNGPAPSRRTLVTDPLGVQQVYEHTADGLLIRVSDADGEIMRVEYSQTNRPVRLVDSAGNETQIAYDAQNRIIRQRISDGTEKTFSYDARGRLVSKAQGSVRIDYVLDDKANVIETRSTDASVNYRARYDERGRLVSLTASSGRTYGFEYDSLGNERAFIDPQLGRFTTERDALGRMVADRLPSGLTFNYEYDARGWLVRERDSQGRAVALERDASGMVKKLTTAQGAWVAAERDEAGRIIKLTNSAGMTRRFRYDGRGALTEYVDARGSVKRMEYDRRGRLKAISDDQGNRVTVERDRSGKITRLAMNDGRRYRIERGADGHAVAIKPEGGEVRFERASYAKRPTLQDLTWWDCMFSPWQDGWSNWYQPLYDMGYDFVYDCSDPFGWGLGGDYLGDPFAGGPCETREQCENRIRAEADRVYQNCINQIAFSGVMTIIQSQVTACRVTLAAGAVGGPEAGIGAGLLLDVGLTLGAILDWCRQVGNCIDQQDQVLARLVECQGKPERCP